MILADKNSVQPIAAQRIHGGGQLDKIADSPRSIIGMADVIVKPIPAKETNHAK